MLQVLFVVVVLISLSVIPVMLAARLVGAGKTGFGSALLAVFLQTGLSAITREFVDSLLLAVIVAVVFGSAIYAFTLDTTWFGGLAISILTIVIGIIAIFLLVTSIGVLGSAA